MVSAAMSSSDIVVEIESPRASKTLSKLVPRNRHWLLVSLIVLSTIHPTILGYDSLMTGGILNLESYLAYFDLTPVTIGLNNAVMWMGQILATLTLSQFLSDKLGRKKAIVIGLCIIVVGVVLQSAAQHIAMFLVGRLFIGFGSSITNITAIVLLAELCPSERRGFLMGLAFSTFLVGGLIASGLTYALRDLPGNWNWRVPSIIQGVPQIVAFINLLFLPESPRWLLANGYTQMAFEILMIKNIDDKEQTDSDLKDFTVEKQAKLMNKNYHPMAEFFKSRINVHRAFISLIQALITEMAGSSVGTYYLAILLEEAGISSSKQRLEANIAMSAWQLVCACTGAALVDRFGRKKQAMASLTGMVVCFLILGGLIKKYSASENNSAIYGTVSVMFMFSGFYSFTFTPLTTVYSPELYPFDMRSAGANVFQLMNASFGLVSSFILPIAMSNIGWKYYIINGCYDIIFIPLVYFFWVETKGIDLERVDEIFWMHPLHRKYAPMRDDIEESESVEHQSERFDLKV